MHVCVCLIIALISCRARQDIHVPPKIINMNIHSDYVNFTNHIITPANAYENLT